MNSRLHHLSLLLGLLALAVGCQRGTSPIAPIVDADAPAAQTMNELSPLGMWRLAIDATSLEAEATYLPDRNASEQGDAFLLPLNRFITASTFELLRVGRVDDQLLVTYRVTHPFEGPSDPTAPSSATNRADLGFAGVVLFLADVESAEGQTFFDGVVANTELVANADAYWQPSGMIARTASLTANCFPGLNVVDESGTGNRVGISNGGNPTGNFGANGWTRSDLGDAPFTGWTGYGVLHQGQAADRTVTVNLGAETSISLDVALIAKYTDPRGGSTPSERQAHRLPSKPADFRSFAYRMPHGALDVSECRVLSAPQQLTLTYESPAFIDCEILDWDREAVESTAALLAEEPDLGRVLPGTSGLSQLEFDCPSLLDTPVAGQPITTGTPFSRYSLTVATDRTVPDGRYPGLIRMTDPEASLPDSPLTVLDAALQPISSFHPMHHITYQAVPLRVHSVAGWVHLFQFDHDLDPQSVEDGTEVRDLAVDTAGNSYVLCTFSGGVNFDPLHGGPILEPGDGADYGTFVAALAPSGDLAWMVHWPINVYLDELVLSPGGAMLYCGMSGGAIPADFDPGPGVEPSAPAIYGDGIVGIRTIDGSYAGTIFWPRPGGPNLRHVVQPNGNMLAAMTFNGELDLDPGPAVESAFNAYGGLALVELSPAGQYLDSRQLVGGVEESYIAERFRVSNNAAGDTVLCGGFNGTFDFDPGPGVLELTSALPPMEGHNPFMLNFDAEGTLRWVRTWDLQGMSDQSEVLVTAAGSPIVAGDFTGVLDADPSAGIRLFDAESVSSFRNYILQLTPTGDFVWAGMFDEDVGARSLSAPTEDAIIIVVGLSGTEDVAPSPHDLVLTSDGYAQTILLALSTADGRVLSHLQPQVASATVDSRAALGQLRVAPSDGTLRWAGSYTQCQLDADPGPDEMLLPYALEYNGVVLRLNADGTW